MTIDTAEIVRRRNDQIEAWVDRLIAAGADATDLVIEYSPMTFTRDGDSFTATMRARIRPKTAQERLDQEAP